MTTPQLLPTAAEVTAGVDLTGSRALVTGTTAGIGAETARVLAAAGAEVLMTGRTEEGARAACARVAADVPGARLVPLALDLGSLASVRACAAALLADGAPLHRIIANAGVMAAPEGRTEDGFETHIGVNHLGHFALLTALQPALLAAGSARVVILSSAGHRWSDVDLDRLAEGPAPYDPYLAYGASKTANALCAVELDRRWRDDGVRAFAVHPGAIHTDLGRHFSTADREQIEATAATNGIAFRTVPQGAATSVWAAVAPELADRGGLYLTDCAVAEVTGPESPRGVRDYALDGEHAARLWTVSERLVGC
ncbi:SDR family NAD(P)-dependent oxidoreductase [Pseudonocardia sp. NPDC049154]|uniref:SDR family NAD(P)-dependent oxidoreductase n=1 Tax=Pseudonocardia sp. NPDC049154 TaxID=3155501 RepID=UPI0033DF4059